MAADRPLVTGNRLVLAGAVMYLLEWVGIFASGDSGPSDPALASSKVLALYTAHPTAVAFLASWISLVLLGRVLLVIGLRSALQSTGADTALVTFAAAAMTLSVAIEVVSEAIVGGATVLASRSASPDTIRALDAVAGFTWHLIFAPLGVAVAVSAWAMLRSRAFPAWMCWVGLVAGTILVVGGVMSGPGYLHSGVARGLMNAAQGAAALFWVWMLATGIFLWRRTPRRAATTA